MNESTAPSQASSPSLLTAGLKARCPRCGQGALLGAGLALKPHCAVCGLSFDFADAGDGPAIIAIFILGFLVLGCALLVEFKLAPPLWVHVLLWGVVTPGLAVVLLRVLKATLILLQYRHRAGEARSAQR
jgi:uncharacterized protein (DUF983 family)